MQATERSVTRELACKLNEAELLERGELMAGCESKIETLKAERRRLNAAIREQSDQRSDLGEMIETKSETRDVPCRYQPDYKRKLWSLQRDDTKEEVETREMTEADLQTRLEIGDSPAEKKPRKKAAKSSKKATGVLRAV